MATGVKLIKLMQPVNTRADNMMRPARLRLEEIADIIIGLHQQYVSRFSQETNRPDFTKEVDNGQRGVFTVKVLMTGETAEQAGLSVWQLLDRGTSVRYMQLSRDWQSKTRPNTTNVGPGRGQRLGVDKERPHLGIEGRNINETIMNGVEKFMFISMQFKIEQGAQNS